MTESEVYFPLVPKLNLGTQLSAQLHCLGREAQWNCAGTGVPK